MMDKLTVMGCLEELMQDGWQQWYSDSEVQEIAKAAFELLKEQDAVEPHYTTLRYLVNGTEVAIQHPECPRCIENGLMLWDAEIEKGQAYCKRCGQKVKWNGFN